MIPRFQQGWVCREEIALPLIINKRLNVRSQTQDRSHVLPVVPPSPPHPTPYLKPFSPSGWDSSPPPAWPLYNSVACGYTYLLAQATSLGQWLLSCSPPSLVVWLSLLAMFSLHSPLCLPEKSSPYFSHVLLCLLHFFIRYSCIWIIQINGSHYVIFIYASF